ncbi:hypothetical protein BASA81_017467 [Batrachochytrium salamandrivorans]|nr:hypothetical protein BASA81_017467 [Batrachochytrium salamandrivorans]
MDHLAADTTGHSLDLQYWHDRQPIQVSPNTPTIRNSDILDQDFSWNQIAAALLQMSPRKAPGDDGITTAFYQAALYMPANTQEGVPPTPFARALLRVCGQVFASATIPRAWLCASIVSIDKKDGDPLNPGDKRGIALINVGLKLVCKVLQMRIERFVETNNLLSYEQAGFRKREECVGQVVSLVDIIQRRQNAGLNTHVLFIDIRKAFDTVPVGALLWKLQNMGFPRRTLAFLKALYTSSSARARAGSLLSGPIPIPGLPRDTNPIRGLMYADDVAVFADSEQSLLAASTAIEQWANQWEMQFGVAKCGIISFTGHLAPRLDNPLDIRLHGQLVSRVESYKYLGVLIDSKLDHSAWLKQKRSALEHTISALHPVLANHQLTTTINKGIRLFTGARLSTAIGPLLVETGIGSLLTRSLVSRVRLLERSVTKRTPINAICSGTDNDVFTLNVQGQLVRSQRWFWSRRTKQLYRNRYWLTPQVRPKTVKQRHSFALMETLRTCGDSASLQKYVTRQLLDTSGFFKDPSFDQSRAHGTRYLMLARMDALWTARKAIQIGILVDTHPFSVDHCILCDQQLLSTSIAHLVVECEQVTGHRIQSGLVPAIQKSRLRLLGRALDPGVENVYTWLRGGVLNGEADLDQRWLDGTVEHESMGTRHDNRALAARLADFLQVAYRQYQSTLWKYHRDRLVEQLLSTSIAHLVVECEQVTGHRIQSGLVPAIQKSRLRLLGRALDPGVENVYTWLRGGVLNGEADLDQRWLDGTVEHESMGTRHDNRALAARLADFLQVAYRQYQSTLWKYHRDRLAECNTLRDEWSRLKAAATQLERADGRKQWVKHADNLDRAVSDGRTDLVFAAARAMSGNSSRSAAVTPLYNSNGIVQYDPTSILRVMQGHYGSLAADTTGHSLDLQYWHDRQPIQVSRDYTTNQKQ